MMSTSAALILTAANSFSLYGNKNVLEVKDKPGMTNLSNYGAVKNYNIGSFVSKGLQAMI